MNDGPWTSDHRRKHMKKAIIILIIGFTSLGCKPQFSRENSEAAAKGKGLLSIRTSQEGSFSVYRGQSPEPLLTQVAKPDERPYIHPIIAPDGRGVLTEYRPKHHLHQTGLYWGLKRLNG